MKRNKKPYRSGDRPAARALYFAAVRMVQNESRLNGVGYYVVIGGVSLPVRMEFWWDMEIRAAKRMILNAK